MLSDKLIQKSFPFVWARGRLYSDEYNLNKNKGDYVYGYYNFLSSNNPVSSSSGKEFINAPIYGDWNMSSFCLCKVYEVNILTGILDKNGMMIYSNDLIEVKGHTYEDDFEAKVTWKNGGFWLDRDYLGMFKSYMLEIKGDKK